MATNNFQQLLKNVPKAVDEFGNMYQELNPLSENNQDRWISL
jgi:hypothetical protein